MKQKSIINIFQIYLEIWKTRSFQNYEEKSL